MTINEKIKKILAEIRELQQMGTGRPLYLKKITELNKLRGQQTRAGKKKKKDDE
jgi:hypothetical protein